MEDINDYKYAEILRGEKDGKLCIGVKLLREYNENAIKIGKRKCNGKIVEQSLSIDNKNVIGEAFGIQGTQNKATRYSVNLDENEKNIFVISGE